MLFLLLLFPLFYTYTNIVADALPLLLHTIEVYTIHVLVVMIMILHNSSPFVKSHYYMYERVVVVKFCNFVQEYNFIESSNALDNKIHEIINYELVF